MEFINFKIRPSQQSVFEEEFQHTIKKNGIACKQWEFLNDNDFTVASIPKYAIDKNGASS